MFGAFVLASLILLNRAAVCCCSATCACPTSNCIPQSHLLVRPSINKVILPCPYLLPSPPYQLPVQMWPNTSIQVYRVHRSKIYERDSIKFLWCSVHIKIKEIPHKDFFGRPACPYLVAWCRSRTPIFLPALLSVASTQNGFILCPFRTHYNVRRSL